MLLYPPTDFDANEWFLLASFLFAVLAILFFKKIFPPSIAFIVMLFSAIMGHIVDHLLGSPPIDLYDINDTSQFEIFDEFTYFLYAPFGYLFVYFYERWRLKRTKTLYYIVCWTAFSAGYEWLASRLGVFHYKGWEFHYSVTFYMIALSLTLWFYTAVRHSLKPSSSPTDRLRR